MLVLLLVIFFGCGASSGSNLTKSEASPEAEDDCSFKIEDINIASSELGIIHTNCFKRSFFVF